jgi:hypothetical protein
MFSNAKVGDKVWDFINGWGTISAIYTDVPYPIMVLFLGRERDAYTSRGQMNMRGGLVTLFWDEIKYEIPTKPKRMVTKTIECWVNVYSNGVGCLTESEEAADKAKRGNYRVACVKLTGTYEVEED